MTDPNYSHEYEPNHLGFCKAYIGSRICGMKKNAQPHLNFLNAARVFFIDFSIVADKKKIDGILDDLETVVKNYLDENDIDHGPILARIR